MQTLSPPTLSPLDSWVLVGNGPSAIRRPLGPLIDAHDNVVRFNRYETIGHEAAVGSRTTYWATHGIGWRAPDGTRHTPMAPGNDEPRPEAALITHGRVPCPILDIPVHYVRLAAFVELRERLGLPIRQIPTTGITVIYWLLRDVGVQRIHLLGFDGFSKRVAKNHHYWDPKVYRRPAEHDGDAEMKLLRHWAAVGRVAFLSCLAVGFLAV